MNWTLVKWIGIGLVVAGALVTAAVSRLQAVAARGERDAAIVSLRAAEANLDVERISTRAAIDAAMTSNNETREALTRCSTVLDGMRVDADRYRVALRSCRTPDAVADRMGALFP